MKKLLIAVALIAISTMVYAGTSTDWTAGDTHITRIVIYPNVSSEYSTTPYYAANVRIDVDNTIDGVTRRVSKSINVGDPIENKLTLAQQYNSMANVGTPIRNILKEAVLEMRNEDISQ